MISLPDSVPFCWPDLSNKPEYCAILSGVSGGIRTPPPVPCGWSAFGGKPPVVGEAAAGGGGVTPSNLGRGAAVETPSV